MRLKKSKLSQILFSTLAFFIVIYIKIPPIADLGDLLWAEDANVFINDVFQYGYGSIFREYAGYYHLYPRLWALMLPVGGLSIAPALLLTGWAVAVLFAGYIFINVVQNFGLNFYNSLLLTCLIFLQPNAGEVYFTITNAQWFLGFAVAIWFLVREEQLHPFVEIPVVIILCLTGPFAILLLPVLIIKYFIDENWNPNKKILIFYFLCILIQAIAFATASRHSLPMDLNLSNWIDAGYIFASLGMNGFARFFAIAFWAALILFLFRNLKSSKNFKIYGNILLLIAYGFIVYLASLYASKHAPNVLSPVGGGSRYFWIPYATIFTAFIILSQGAIQRFFAYGLLATICLIGLSSPKVGRQSTDFHANEVFAKISSNDIKINPFWEINPPAWRIKANQTYSDGLVYEKFLIQSQDLKFINGLIKLTSDGFLVQEFSGDPALTIEMPKACSKYDFFALSAEITRTSNSYAQIFWADHKNPNFSEASSRTSFVGSGRSISTFALKKSSNIEYLRFDPSRDGLEQLVHRIEIYCF
jgi:hypothetical protein